MIIPVYRNIRYEPEHYLERSLPNKGKILVEIGDKLSSYTKIGYSRNSNKELIIPSDFNVDKKFKKSNVFKMGDLLASKGKVYIFAPFDGFIEDRGSFRVFVKHPEDYWCLSGVSGSVEKIIQARSCLIKTRGYFLRFFATSTPSCEGELQILPNPSELIELDFMEKYIKDGLGKLVYTGDYLRKSMLQKAIEIGCEGIICGSTDRETLNYAKQSGFFVGVLSGFGRIPSTSKVFDLLKELDSSYGIVNEGSDELFVSSEVKGNYLIKSFAVLKEGLSVVSLAYPYFGWEGEITKVESEIVFVKILKTNEVIKTSKFNVIALP